MMVSTHISPVRLDTFYMFIWYSHRCYRNYYTAFSNHQYSVLQLFCGPSHCYIFLHLWLFLQCSPWEVQQGHFQVRQPLERFSLSQTGRQPTLWQDLHAVPVYHGEVGAHDLAHASEWSPRLGLLHASWTSSLHVIARLNFFFLSYGLCVPNVFVIHLIFLSWWIAPLSAYQAFCFSYVKSIFIHSDFPLI